MNRTDVIQKIISKKKARKYLEIGVANGKNFFPIKARQKIAVDPKFIFSKKRRIIWMLRNFYNITSRFYEMRSDTYFANAKVSNCQDVVFIDGLHSYKQSLKDVKNVLRNLDKNGVIIMHDCCPPHKAAAHPADSYNHAVSLNIPGWDRQWCGDVWKTICYLRSCRKDLKVFVLSCDYGLGIITRGESENTLSLTEDDLDKMNYDDLVKNRENYLNIKDESYLFEFLKTI